jgi:hypothetical protein
VFEAGGPQLGGSQLGGPELGGPELGAEYDGAGLDGAELDGAGLDGAALDGAGLDGAGLDGAGLDGPGLDGPGLDGPGLDAAGLDGAGLDGAAGELVQTVLTGAEASVWTIMGPVSAMVEPHGAILGAACAVARNGAGETWLVWGEGLFTSLSGPAGTVDFVRAGDLRAWTRPACDCLAWVSPAGPLMN